MSNYREREDKYEVPPDLSVAEGLIPFLARGTRIVQGEQDIDNLYFDTASRALLRHRVTLRRRRGGADSGWHVKLPSGKARTEIRVDDATGDHVPEQLAELVIGVTRGHELSQVARLQTHRLTHRLLDRDDAVLVEVDDDTVHATSRDTANQWREVEIEVGDRGDEKLLASIGKSFRRVGAKPSPYPSKLARALVLDEPSAADASPLMAYLQAQYRRLVAEDVALRRGHGDVHKTRVTIRRLRSTLRTFGPIFEADRMQPLDDELRWYAGVLGEVRDRQVLRRYLDRQVDSLPPELRLGPVKARIDEQLLSEALRAQADVEAAARSERYFALLDQVERFVFDPPRRGATSPKKLRRLARRASHKATKRLTRALAADDATDEAGLHRARKSAKRARYAAELVQPVVGKSQEAG